MKPCKRIEIVIERPLAPRMEDRLVELGVPGYTLIDHASGLGNRGKRRADDPTGSSTNVVFIIACPPELDLDGIVDGVRPLLTQSGGICLVSDAMWLRH